MDPTLGHICHQQMSYWFFNRQGRKVAVSRSQQLQSSRSWCCAAPVLLLESYPLNCMNMHYVGLFNFTQFNPSNNLELKTRAASQAGESRVEERERDDGSTAGERPSLFPRRQQTTLTWCSHWQPSSGMNVNCHTMSNWNWLKATIFVEGPFTLHWQSDSAQVVVLGREKWRSCAV